MRLDSGNMRGSVAHHVMRGWPCTQDVETGLPPHSRVAQKFHMLQGTGSGPAGACPTGLIVTPSCLFTGNGRNIGGRCVDFVALLGQREQREG